MPTVVAACYELKAALSDAGADRGTTGWRAGHVPNGKLALQPAWSTLACPSWSLFAPEIAPGACLALLISSMLRSFTFYTAHQCVPSPRLHASACPLLNCTPVRVLSSTAHQLVLSP